MALGRVSVNRCAVPELRLLEIRRSRSDLEETDLQGGGTEFHRCVFAVNFNVSNIAGFSEMVTMSVNELKDEGNRHFRLQDYGAALEKYMEALKVTNESDLPTKAILHNNKAVTYLKLDRYGVRLEPRAPISIFDARNISRHDSDFDTDAIESGYTIDCSRKVLPGLNDCGTICRFEDAREEASTVLLLEPNNVKALFRRAQANEALGKYDLAFKDARQVLHLEAKNQTVLPLLERLSAKLQDIAKEQSSTKSKAENMLSVIGDASQPLDKKMAAVNNLIVICRERAGADIIMKLRGVQALHAAMKLLKNDEFNHACVRIFGEICKRGSDQSLLIVKTLGKRRRTSDHFGHVLSQMRKCWESLRNFGCPRARPRIPRVTFQAYPTCWISSARKHLLSSSRCSLWYSRSSIRFPE